MTDELLIYAATGSIATACAVAAYTIARTPPAVSPRLGPRGYQRHRARANNKLFAQIEPAMRFVAAFIARLPLENARKRADVRLSAAGDYLGLTADEYLALQVLGALLGITLGLLVGGGEPLLPMAGAAVGFIWPRHMVSARASLRAKQIRRGLPPAIDLTALCLGAGLDFPGALKQVTGNKHQREDALTDELRAVLRDLQLGHTRRQALRSFAERVNLEEVSDFVAAVTQAEERGNPLAEVLRIQAEVLRQRRSVKGEEAAARASVLLIAPLVMLILSVMVIIIAPLLMRSMSAFTGG